MGVMVAGDAGSVLVAEALADEPFAAVVLEGLAEPTRTPRGTTALTVSQLAGMSVPPGVGAAELLYGEERTRREVRAWAAAHGLGVRDAGAVGLRAPEGVKVVAVSSPTTGSGKTAVSRKLARTLARSGVRAAVVRHPIANLLLHRGRRETIVVSEQAAVDALDGPLEEREELAPLAGTGAPVVAGLDPRAILAEAAGRGRVLVWDGGGSAEPWLAADLRVAVVDPYRALPPSAEAHVVAAHAVVIAKADTAPAERVREVEEVVRGWNPGADVTLCDMPVAVSDGRALTGRAVLVVEDWPSLLLGGFAAGGGAVAARRFRTGVVDPRPAAVGALRRAYEDHTHVGPVVPSLGRTAGELEDLAATIRAVRCEVVLWASPASPDGIVDPGRLVVRAYADVMEVAGAPLQQVLRPLLPGGGPLPIAGVS